MPDEDHRALLTDLVQVPHGDRRAALEQGLADRRWTLADIQADNLGGSLLSWIDKIAADPDTWAKTIKKQYPEPLGIDLGTASMSIEAIEWLWRGWVPFGFVTLLCGQSGVGKSKVALELAAAALGHQPWPDGTMSEGAAHHQKTDTVVWLDTESSQALLIERVQEKRLDLRKFRWPLDPREPGNVTPSFLLNDEATWKNLHAYVDEWRPIMLVIDSLSGGHTKDENGPEMRMVMKRMTDLTRDLHIALVLVHHINKAKEGQRTNIVELERVRGHSSIFQLSRPVVAIDMPDTETGALRLRVIKTNFRLPDALGMVIRPDGAVQFDAENVPTEPRKWTSIDDAVEFLRTALQAGAKARSEIKAESEALGIPWRAIMVAKANLRVSHRKYSPPGMPPGSGHWRWELPVYDTPPRWMQQALAAEEAASGGVDG